jgi:hypothetical protein
MSNPSGTPNFFILLGLDPKAPWNQAEFERVLLEKKREWAKQMMRPDNIGKNAKLYHGLIPKIEQAMRDDKQRADQAKAAIDEAEQANKAQVQEFEEALKIAQLKGYMLEAEVAKLVNDYKALYSEQEIRRRIKVEIRAKARSDRKPQLEPAQAKRIREDLALLHKPSLYALLEEINPRLNERSNRTELLQAATDLYTRMGKVTAHDSTSDTKKRLSGEGMDIFKTDEKRQQYDETLRQQGLEETLKLYEAAWIRAQQIDAQQAQAFLRAARTKGWSVDELVDLLSDLGKKHKIPVLLPPEALKEIEQQQLCGICGHLNDKNSVRCQGCGEELRIKCPRCSRDLASEDFACGQCGFPAGNRYSVRQMIKEGERLLRARQLADAQSMLEDAERDWPADPTKDALAQQIHSLKSQAQQRLQEEQQASAQLRQLIDQRHLFAARQALLALPESLPNRAAYQRDIEDGIRQAQAAYQRIFQQNLSSDQKIDLCMQALRLCADYADPRSLLATMPPEPPTNLQVSPGERIVSLRWSPSTSANARYAVVRKIGGQPVSAKDGKQLAIVPGQVYDDSAPEIGAPLFYAIFADREGIVSPRGAVAARPVLLTSDVANLTHRINDGSVELSWAVPPNTRNIIIMRKEGAPPNSPTDGTRLQPLQMTQLVDRNLQNGHRYFYTLYVEFTNLDGSQVYSKGVTIEATPERPPEPVSQLQINMTQTQAGYQVDLAWPPPPKGDVVILKTPQPTRLALGDVIPAASLQQHGQVLQGRQNTLSDLWAGTGIAFYLPVVIFQNMAYIGQTHRWVCVEDVTNLKEQNLGQALRLTWNWPTNCQAVLVLSDTNGWPSQQSATARKIQVSRAEYERLGYYDLKLSSSQDCYLIVAALVTHGNEIITGAGARRQIHLASKVTLRYEVKTSGGMFGGKQRVLYLYTSGSTHLPAIILRTRHGGMPRNKSDGEYLMQLDGPIAVSKQEAKFTLPDQSFPKDTYVKLFLEDDNSYAYITVEHDMTKLRLS